MLLVCDIYVVLVGPYCLRVCAFREIVVPLQRFSLRHKQKRGQLVVIRSLRL